MPELAAGFGTPALFGTPLQEVDALDTKAQHKLKALSVQTVEELLGLISADGEAVVEFLDGADLALLQADIAREANTAVMADANALSEDRYALGAMPPSSITPEEQASSDTFEQYVAQVQPVRPAPGEPSEVDMRDCMGPVRNQGARGTCVAFATCAVLECLERRRTQVEVDLSEQFCYWECKQHDGIPDRGGTYIAVAMPQAESDGVCLEGIWPYDANQIPGNEAQGPPPPGSAADAAAHRPASVELLDGRSSAEIRKALDAGSPVAISIPVYRNWIANPVANALGRIPMPLPHSPLEGGHAMCCVGYRYDAEAPGGGYLIIRNSWGEGWAPRSQVAPGYGILPYLYVDTYGWEAWTAQ
jgi:hypothetical protein